MVVIASETPGDASEEVIEVPSTLVRDLIDGVVYPYKGWKEVLEAKKTKVDIMGSSGLQSYIISMLQYGIIDFLDRKKYRLLGNEVENHLGKKNNLSYDLAIYSKDRIPKEKLTEKYIDLIPDVVIEVDVNVDTTDKSELEYIHQKINKVIAEGASRVLWIFTKPEMIISAVPNQEWKIFQWEDEVTVLENYTINLRAEMDKYE